MVYVSRATHSSCKHTYPHVSVGDKIKKKGGTANGCTTNYIDLCDHCSMQAKHCVWSSMLRQEDVTKRHQLLYKYTPHFLSILLDCPPSNPSNIRRQRGKGYISKLLLQTDELGRKLIQVQFSSEHT